MNAPFFASSNALLYEHPANPVPEGAVAGYVETPDAAELRYAHWRSAVSPSKGTVVIANGRTEFIEKYFETVNDLRRNGYGVLTFDWRGQGLSSRLLRDRRKGFIENFDQYVTDFNTILEEVALPDCRAPYFVLGHSTGSLVALLAAPQSANRIRRMVLASPLLEFATLPMSQSKVKMLCGFLTMIGLGEMFVDGNKTPIETRPFLSNRITSDSARFKRNGDLVRGHPDLSLGGPTTGWVYEACKAMDRVWDPDFMATITVPTLLVAAGNDKVVSVPAIEEFGELLRAGAHLTIHGARHEILQERDVYREQMLAAFYAFAPGTGI